jgi:hypothetical protein
MERRPSVLRGRIAFAVQLDATVAAGHAVVRG